MRFIRDLTVDTIKLLNRIYKQSSHYQVKKRVHHILLSYEGVTRAEIDGIFSSKLKIYIQLVNYREEYRLLGLYNPPERGRKQIFDDFQEL